MDKIAIVITLVFLSIATALTLREIIMNELYAVDGSLRKLGVKITGIKADIKSKSSASLEA